MIDTGEGLPRLSIVTDKAEIRRAIYKWAEAFVDDTKSLPEETTGSVEWRDPDFGVKVKIDLEPFDNAPQVDPFSADLGRLEEDGLIVTIRVPSAGFNDNVLGAVAKDKSGTLYILRQGALHANPLYPRRVTEDDVARIPNELIRREIDLKTDRGYYQVARLGDRAEIRQQTIAFIEACRRLRVRANGEPGSRAANIVLRTRRALRARPGSPEKDESYIRSAVEEKQVRQKQGAVWQVLAKLLDLNKINYSNTRIGSFGTDMIVIGPQADKILIEIKCGMTAADRHAGVGQLLLYDGLLTRADPPESKADKLVLLLPFMPAGPIPDIYRAHGISIITFSMDPIGFSAELYDALGIAH